MTQTKTLYRVRINPANFEPMLESVDTIGEDENYWYLANKNPAWVNWDNAVNKRRESIAETPEGAWRAFLRSNKSDAESARNALAISAKNCEIAKAALLGLGCEAV